MWYVCDSCLGRSKISARKSQSHFYLRFLVSLRVLSLPLTELSRCSRRILSRADTSRFLLSALLYRKYTESGIRGSNSCILPSLYSYSVVQQRYRKHTYRISSVSMWVVRLMWCTSVNTCSTKQCMCMWVNISYDQYLISFISEWIHRQSTLRRLQSDAQYISSNNMQW